MKKISLYSQSLFRSLSVCLFLFSLFIPAFQAQAVVGAACDETSDCGGYACNLGKDNPATPAFEGICTGSCTSDAECSEASGSLGWAGAKCTGTVASPGVCLELPRAASNLNDTPLVDSGADLLNLVNTMTNWVFAIFVVLSIIFVLLAAFQFVTGGGDAKKVEEARQKLIWAAVGIIIALLSKGLVPVIRSIVGG